MRFYQAQAVYGFVGHTQSIEKNGMTLTSSDIITGILSRKGKRADRLRVGTFSKNPGKQRRASQHQASKATARLRHPLIR